MATFISRRRHESVTMYERVFDYEGESGWGFAFPCDQHGNVSLGSLTSVTVMNLTECLAGVVNGRKVVDRGVRAVVNSYWIPARIRCECGHELVLDSSWANGCDCGREYNGSGQLLAPRSEWGQETGERFV